MLVVLTVLPITLFVGCQMAPGNVLIPMKSWIVVVCPLLLLTLQNIRQDYWTDMSSHTALCTNNALCPLHSGVVPIIKCGGISFTTA